MADADKDEPISDRSFMLFGRDVTKIPCFRSTILYGILGGMGTGLTYFLFTSRVRRATDVGFASYVVISLGYWIRCRYIYGKTKYEMMRMQHALATAAIFEGTEYERKLDAGEKVDI